MFCNLIGENVEKIVDKEGSKKSISEVTTQEDSKSIAVSVKTQPSRNMDYKHIAETFMNEKMLSNARNVAENTRGKVTKEDIKEMSIQKCNSFEDRPGCEVLESRNKKGLKEDEEKRKGKEHIGKDDKMDEVQSGGEILLQQKKRGFKGVGR